MTPAHYRSLISRKAGVAVALPVEGAAILAALSKEEVAVASKAGRAFGVAYQAGDDLADLAADLRIGALNGAIVQALHTASPLERIRLLTLLDRARHSGLSDDEVIFEARRLAPQAQLIAEWAHVMLDGVAADVASHKLGSLLTASAAALALRLQPSALARHHAA
jgi:geranylgeranyl pyrophosphate synthase